MNNIGFFDLSSKFFFHFAFTNARNIFFRIRRGNFLKFNNYFRKVGNSYTAFFGSNFFYPRYFNINFVSFFVVRFFKFYSFFNYFFLNRSNLKKNKLANFFSSYFVSNRKKNILFSFRKNFIFQFLNLFRRKRYISYNIYRLMMRNMNLNKDDFERYLKIKKA